MIAFTKEMEIGIPKIDAQHKELINRMNQVEAMGLKSFSKEETQKTLDFLGEYVVKHFADEEVLQQQSSYPKYEEHKNMHKLFVADFVKLKEEFNRNGASAGFTFGLNRSIISWVINHIKYTDTEFGKYYQTHVF
jgi:hemerythrin